MHATPIQLVAAPGAGKFNIPFMLALQAVPGGTLFTGGGTINLCPGVGGAGTTLTQAIPASLLTANLFNPSVCFAGVISPGSNVYGLNSALCITNQTAAFATGNGSVIAEVFYQAF